MSGEIDVCERPALVHSHAGHLAHGIAPLHSFPAARRRAAAIATPAQDAVREAVRSVQRNPVAEEPESPSTEDRVEDRNGVEAAVIQPPEIAPVRNRCRARGRPIDGSIRPEVAAVPTAGRRWPVPVGWRRSGRRSTVPSETVLRRRRRRAMVGCAEAMRRVPGAAPLGVTPIELTLRSIRRRRRSTGTPGHPVREGPGHPDHQAHRVRQDHPDHPGPTRATRTTRTCSPPPPGPPGSHPNQRTRARTTRPTRTRTTRTTEDHQDRRGQDHPDPVSPTGTTRPTRTGPTGTTRTAGARTTRPPPPGPPGPGPPGPPGAGPLGPPGPTGSVSSARPTRSSTARTTGGRPTGSGAAGSSGTTGASAQDPVRDRVHADRPRMGPVQVRRGSVHR